MVWYHCYVFLVLFVICVHRSLAVYQCHQCNAMIYNHPVTIDTLPSPTEDDCDIVKAIHGCYIHVVWHADGTSEVYYRLDPPLPFDSVLVVTESQLDLTSSTSTTERAIGYSCRSNHTACNTIDRLKHAILSTTFPSNDQLKHVHPFLTSTKTFNPSHCFFKSNGSRCLPTNTRACQQCLAIANYRETTEICAACSDDEVTSNFLHYSSIFLLHNRTRSDHLRLGCQTCRPLKAMEDIRQNIDIRFNIDNFLRSTTSPTPSITLTVLVAFFFSILSR